MRSPQDESFDLQVSPTGSDDSPGHGAGPGTHQGHPSDPVTPTRRQRRAQKAGTRLAGSGDDTYQFFVLVGKTRKCSFCL